MTDPLDKARRDAEAQVADDRLTKLIESLGGTASAQVVFGTPIEKDGVTVVPVARVRYGVGGGGGRGQGLQEARRRRCRPGRLRSRRWCAGQSCGLHRGTQRRSHLPAHSRPRTLHGRRSALPAECRTLVRNRGCSLGSQADPPLKDSTGRGGCSTHPGPRMRRGVVRPHPGRQTTLVREPHRTGVPGS